VDKARFGPTRLITESSFIVTSENTAELKENAAARAWRIDQNVDSWRGWRTWRQ
jgi:hypothetical protein